MNVLHVNSDVLLRAGLPQELRNFLCVCVYIYIYIERETYIYVYMCMYTYIYIYTHIYICTDRYIDVLVTKL